MTHDVLAAFLCLACLAAGNGANDVSRAAATLLGGGVTAYHRALLWVAACTLAGSLASFILAAGVAARFAAALSTIAVPFPLAIPAVMLGAVAWIVLATWQRLPVATTHAILGALVGLGWLTGGWDGIARQALLAGFVVPLVTSPLISMAIAFGLQHLLSTPGRWGAARVERAHWISCGLVAFSRGVNDSAKIWALVLPVAMVTGLPAASLARDGVMIVALAMLLGAVMFGRRVTETLAFRIRSMGTLDSALANFTTAVTIITGSLCGLPVASSHVVGGAILGSGLATDPASIDWRMVRTMAMAWILTLPAAALLAILTATALRAGLPGVAAAAAAAIAVWLCVLCYRGFADLMPALLRRHRLLVVFVCTSNTSRSPMAAMICTKLLAATQGPAFAISRGLTANAGSPLSVQAAPALGAQGIIPKTHRSRNLGELAARRADIIFCMTEQQAVQAQKMFPRQASKIVRLDPARDIDDPSRGGAAAYAAVAAQLAEAIGMRLAHGGGLALAR